MGKNSNDGWKDLNKPVRKQDPYVSGYRNGGEGPSSGSGGSGSGNNESCGEKAATMAAIAVIATLSLRAMIRARR